MQWKLIDILSGKKMSSGQDLSLAWPFVPRGAAGESQPCSTLTRKTA